MSDTCSTNLYKSHIIDHYKNPRNNKLLKDFNKETEVSNSSCGDEIKLNLKLDKGGKIEDIGYDVHGCAVCVASISMLSEKVKEMKKDDYLKIDEDCMFEMMGIDSRSGRKKCVLLALDALKSALGK